MTNAEKIKQIPHGKLVRFRSLYDGFEKKDMPFADFVCQLMGLEDENRMQDDLEVILRRKRAFSANKQMIRNVL